MCRIECARCCSCKWIGINGKSGWKQTEYWARTHQAWGMMRSRVVGRYVCRFVANQRSCQAATPWRGREFQLGGSKSFRTQSSRAVFLQVATIVGLRRDLAADDELIVAMVATIRPIKDYATFLRAAHIVADRRPKVRFVSIGGKVRRQFRRPQRSRATRLGLADKNCLAWRRRQSFLIASLSSM